MLNPDYSPFQHFPSKSQIFIFLDEVYEVFKKSYVMIHIGSSFTL